MREACLLTRTIAELLAEEDTLGALLERLALSILSIVRAQQANSFAIFGRVAESIIRIGQVEVIIVLIVLIVSK